jgi:hypothetical protein
MAYLLLDYFGKIILMEKIIKRELIWYTAILTLLIFVMHPDMLSDPIPRLALMQERTNYIHPLLYTFFVYLVVFLFRAVISFIAGKFKKRESGDESAE